MTGTDSQAELQEKLERPRGLCTCVIYDDFRNAQRIRFILDAYLGRSVLMEMSPRSESKWEHCHDLPSDFNNYRYRIAQ